MKRFNLTILILLLSTLYSISQIQVASISDHDVQIKENASLYYLPQTTLEVSISLTTETLIPGPYAKYAEKYLSIKNATTSQMSDIKINKVEIKEITQPDPNSCYVVVGGHESAVNCNRNGIIYGYNCTDIYPVAMDVSREHFFKNEQVGINMPAFLDYGVKRNFTGNTDTTYKVVEVDSVFQKIPVYNKVIISKDEETKAEEAANYIIKIRKRLFKIITAQYDTENPPVNIEIMVGELKRLEKQYLELFVGKIETKTFDYVFYYTPQSSLTDEKIPLGYVTADDEVVAQKVEKSEPIYLTLKNSQATSEMDNFFGRQVGMKKEKEKGLFYCIPSEVMVSVDFEDFTYYRGSFYIPQCGYKAHLSSSLFKNKYLRIEFDDKYGTVKSIKTKE